MKHRLFKLALCLFFGALVNVAVAWGCALWSGTDPEISNFSNYNEIVRDLTILPTQVRKFHESHLPSNQNLVYEVRSISLDFGYGDYLIRSMGVSGVHGLKTDALHVGWPASSLAAYYTEYYREDDSGVEIDSINEEWKSGILLTVNQGCWIPIRPIWPSFAINTIFYAGILWFLTLSPFTARRMIRRKRGHCIKCSYDLRETSGGCPECGWGRENEG